METITLEIPTDWLEGLSLDEATLKQVLRLGLLQHQAQQHHHQAQQHHEQEQHRIQSALLSSGHIQRLSRPTSTVIDTLPRQAPPNLPGPSLSEVIIAQRRGTTRKALFSNWCTSLFLKSYYSALL